MNITKSLAVGAWFKDADGASFEVVSLDEEIGTVFIQYFDGMMDEIDLAHWPVMEFTGREPPTPWVSVETVGNTGRQTVDWERPEQWFAGPLDVVE